VTRRISAAALAAAALLAAVPAVAGAPSRLLEARTPIAERAAVWAAKQRGVHEIGTTNCGRTVERWERHTHVTVPPCRVWCGAFVHEAFRQAGIDLSARFLDPQKVLFDARAHRRHLRLIARKNLHRGDIALMLYRTDRLASHEAVVLRHRAGSPWVVTAEGNTGNAVRIKTHHMSFFVGALRVDPARP
jgi:hypothetical protein